MHHLKGADQTAEDVLHRFVCGKIESAKEGCWDHDRVMRELGQVWTDMCVVYGKRTMKPLWESVSVMVAKGMWK